MRIGIGHTGRKNSALGTHSHILSLLAKNWEGSLFVHCVTVLSPKA